MQKKVSLLRKLSLILGITALLLGLIPVSALGNVGFVSAEGEEPPVEEPLVEEPPVEEPPAEEDLLEEEASFLLLSSNTGPTNESPTDLGLPADQNTPGYQDDCDQPGNDCEKVSDSDLGDVNDVGKGQTFPFNASVVVIKAGNEEFFFYPGGPECDNTSDPYCVVFNYDNTITIYRNAGGPGVKEISNIQFWNPPGDPGGENPCDGGDIRLLDTNGLIICGCPDPDAENFNPEANYDDGSCQYDDPPGGGGGPSPEIPPTGGDPQLIPVTGSDLGGATAAELQLMLRSLGALFLGSNFVIGGIAKRKQQ
jgi:hypothetical protein